MLYLCNCLFSSCNPTPNYALWLDQPMTTGPHHVHAQWICMPVTWWLKLYWFLVFLIVRGQSWSVACLVLVYFIHCYSALVFWKSICWLMHTYACIELAPWSGSLPRICALDCACFLGMLTWYQATISAKYQAFYAIPTDQLFKEHIPSEHRWGEAKVNFTQRKQLAYFILFESTSAKNPWMYKHTSMIKSLWMPWKDIFIVL